jgi:hypothetical protein
MQRLAHKAYAYNEHFSSPFAKTLLKILILYFPLFFKAQKSPYYFSIFNLSMAFLQKISEGKV